MDTNAQVMKSKPPLAWNNSSWKPSPPIGLGAARKYCNKLLDALHEDDKWENLRKEDLQQMIAESEKKRYEISAGRIRAFYGHSIPIKITKEEKKPPKLLYHGTAKRLFNSIIEKGLLPRNRQYVHLSQDIETAFAVGKRHDTKPIILKISALDAWHNGVKFYYGNEKVWLADEIFSKFIAIKDNRYFMISIIKKI